MAIDEHDRVVVAARLDGVARVGDVAAVILGELDERRGQLADRRLGNFAQRRPAAGKQEQLRQADDVGLVRGGALAMRASISVVICLGVVAVDSFLRDRGDPHFARQPLLHARDAARRGRLEQFPARQPGRQVLPRRAPAWSSNPGNRGVACWRRSYSSGRPEKLG